MIPVAPVPQVCPPARRPRSRPGRFLERLTAPFVLLVALVGALFALVASRLTMAGPGVTVETYPTPGRTETLTAPGAAFFVAGLTDRGSAGIPGTVRSYSDFLSKYGPYVPYGNLHDALRLFFAMGGTQAHVIRAVGSSATKGTLTLVDRAGEPDNTLTIDALDAGSWSANVKVQVANGDLASTFTISVWVDDILTETYPNLATPAAAVTALATSSYVRATDAGSATTAPNNNPAVITATALSAGTDDRGTVNGASLVTALAKFGPELGDGIIAIPGYDSSVVGAGLLAHAKANYRLAALATTRTANIAAAKSAAAALNNTPGNQAAILAYPWVKVDDQAGGVRSISPEGFVAGARARAHVQAGPWRAAAGRISVTPQIRGVETTLTEANGEDLNNGRVSHIRLVAGDHQLYGYRTLSIDEVHYRFLTVQDVLDTIAHRGKRALQALTFEMIDSRGHFQNRAETAIINILQPMLAAGGLYELTDPLTGDVIDSAYEVDAGPGVNPPDQVAAGNFTVDAAVRVSPTAEKIRLRITAVALEETLA